jgi:hypothetical protein
MRAQDMVQSLSAITQTKAPLRRAPQTPWNRRIPLAAGGVSLFIVGLLLIVWAMIKDAQVPRATSSSEAITETRMGIGLPMPAMTIAPMQTIGATRLPVATMPLRSATTPTSASERPRPSTTATPTPTPAPARLWTSLHIYRPSLEETQSLPSMWKFAVYRDLFTPGTNTYKVTVHPADVYRWGFSWHARDQARLREILQPLKVELLIDDVHVPDSLIQVYEDVTQDGWVGRRWVTAITDWPAGKTIVLEARYELSREVYDGQNTLAPGVYHQIIYVSVQ